MCRMNWVVTGAIVVLAAACACSGGTLQRVWVVEDFEGYATTEEMVGTQVPQDVLAGRPWWSLWTLREAFGQGSIGDGVTFTAELGTGDPNGFTAVGEAQPTDDPNDLPQGMLVHYAIPSGGESCDMFVFSSAMGLPVEVLHLDPALPVFGADVPTVDMTQFDRISVKIRKRAGNRSSMQGRFEIGFIGWDLKEIGRFATERPVSGPAFMEAGEDVWETLEVDLASEMALPGASDRSVFGLTHVAGMYLGMEDQAAENGGTDAWYAIDEIAFYAESPPCAEMPAGDLTGDCRVDMEDLAAMAGGWLADLAMP